MVTLHAHPPPATKGSSPARVYPVCLATSYLLVVVVRGYPSLLKKPNGLKKLHVTPLDFSMTNKASRFSALVCHRTYELPTGILWPSSPAWAASAAIQLQVTPISKPCESFGWNWLETAITNPTHARVLVAISPYILILVSESHIFKTCASSSCVQKFYLQVPILISIYSILQPAAIIWESLVIRRLPLLCCLVF